MRCTKQVGYDRYAQVCCGKPAKWRVTGFPRCSEHARPNDFYVKRYGRVPIEQPKEANTKRLTNHRSGICEYGVNEQ